MPSATSRNTIVWSASGPKTLSKGYVLVVGPPPPYEDAVVKEDKVEDAVGVVSTVMARERAPSDVVMTGEVWASSCGDRPLYVRYSLRSRDQASLVGLFISTL